MLYRRHALTTASTLRRAGCYNAPPRAHAPLDAILRQYSSQTGVTHDIAILGGGITGLASAYFLTKELPQAKITVYEASDRLGGWLSSKRVPVKDGTVLFEAGPRTLRQSVNGTLAVKLMQELDLAKDAIFTQKTAPAAVNRYIYYPDRLVCMPNPAFSIFDNLWKLISEPVFKNLLWSGITEWSKDPRDEKVEDESVGEFISRRGHTDNVDRLLSGVLHGIYAGDAWQLSAKSLFTSMWRDEIRDGSLSQAMAKKQTEGWEVTKQDAEFIKSFSEYPWEPLLKETMKNNSVFTFKEGLSMLTDRLAWNLIESGKVEFKTSTPVESVSVDENSSVSITAKGSDEPAKHTTAISTLAPAPLNTILKATNPIVPHMPAVTVMTVNLYFRTPGLHPPGFGYLIPLATPFENNPERALGVVFDSAYSPSPADVDSSNWATNDEETLQDLQHDGQLLNVNDFAWYNAPVKPNLQDDVPTRGTKLTVMLGGHFWDDWPAFPSEAEGLALARAVLERHLNISEEPEVSQVNLQRDCIPQYVVGHSEKLRKAHVNLEREFDGRVRVAGNWMGGVGANDCLRTAWDVVQGIKSGRRRTGLEMVGREEWVRMRTARR